MIAQRVESLKKQTYTAARGSLGIYIHVPFCKKKCKYCDFYSIACADGSKMDAYTDALVRHIGEYAPFMKGYTVDTVYFGGGTPTVLGAKRLGRILKAICRGCSVSKSAEITCEANPESSELKLFEALRRAGVNRLSLGVQSASDEELAALGRLHTFAQAAQAVQAARKAGFGNLSLDFMYGLPGQDIAGALASLEKIMALSPEHISCYCLKLEEGTPLWREAPVLPDDDTQADMYLQIVGMLEKSGYEQYEVSNFAKRGYASRHNTRYWKLEEYLGFGPGAHSFFGGRRFSYKRNLDAYLAGGDILDEMEETPDTQRIGEYLMLRLRLNEGIDGEAYFRRFHREFAPVEHVLEQFLAPGYTRRAGTRWSLTPRGMFVSNAIICRVLEALEHAPDAARE